MSYEVKGDYTGHDSFEDANKRFLEVFSGDHESEQFGTDKYELGVILNCIEVLETDDELVFSHQPTPEWAAIQRVLKNTPHTVDNVPICIGDEVWFENPDCGPFESEHFISEKVSSICGRSFDDYQGDFTITCDQYEVGNLDCYSSRESIEKVTG